MKIIILFFILYVIGSNLIENTAQWRVDGTVGWQIILTNSKGRM